MKDKISKLENSLLELGTEMFRLKFMLRESHKLQNAFAKSMQGLKVILDEKGIINHDDFETTVDLNAIVEKLEKQSEMDTLTTDRSLKVDMN